MGKKRLTQDEVLTRFTEAHGTRYNYSKVVYNHTKDKVIITCDIHGDFPQAPVKHWSGRGCPKCRYESLSETMMGSKESFSESALQVHGEDYSYHLVEYVDSTTPVEVYCNQHKGTFWQTPSQHLAGSGCSLCAGYGFNTEIPASVYVMQYENMTKVGITNREPVERARQINKGGVLGFNVVYSELYDLGSVARVVESKLKAYLGEMHSQPTDKFDGYTESFFDVDFPALLCKVTEFSAQARQ